jgi:hypothetical protein
VNNKTRQQDIKIAIANLLIHRFDAAQDIKDLSPKE